MNLPFFIARRYLFAKKSHNVINIISLISAVGIAIGSAALVVVLSVYNGFESLVKDIYSVYEADLVVQPSKGKFFSIDSQLLSTLNGDERVISISQVLEDNVFVSYSGKQGVAIVKGVDSVYTSNPVLYNSIREGEFSLMVKGVPHAVVGRGLARELGLRPHFLDPIELYYPRRGANISMVTPLASLNKSILFPSGIVAGERNIEQKYIFVSIDVLRELISGDGDSDEVSSLEIISKEGADVDRLQRDVKELLGEDFVVKNRYQQNETVYKMMTYEKVAIYMILLFIIIVVACNVFGSLTMLIIEKEDDIHTLWAMGANKKVITRLFILEGWLITFLGMVCGVIFGVALCYVQSYYGVIKMPGNFAISTYPVVVQFGDVLLTIFGVSLVGFLITSLPALKILPKLIKKS